MRISPYYSHQNQKVELFTKLWYNNKNLVTNESEVSVAYGKKEEKSSALGTS